MTTTLTGVSVDSGVPALNARAPSNPVISTAGNDTQSIARQQLPTAVPAPALIAAYSTGIAQQPKPPAKLFSSTPSSGFAAQFIAQGAGNDDDLAIFVPPQVMALVAEESPADDYLNDLRIARGDFSSINKSAPTEASEQADAAEEAELAKPATTIASESSARMGITQVATGLFNQLIRRSTIIQARGVAAYQIAASRNAADRIVTPVTPPVAEPVS